MIGAPRIARAALLALLGAFLVAPGLFAPLFRPFAPGDAPPIYAQTPLLTLAVTHLLLVAAATTIAAAIALGLAVAATRPAGRDVLPFARSVARIGQTFPPVAVLALAVPILGFGAVPTLIALVLYGLLPIFETALTGLEDLDPALMEAARGMGLTDRQRLVRVELPLALPMILSGIRLAAVIGLATATIGSTVAASTLGEVIISGLLTGNTAYVLQGGLAVSALALLIDGGFRSLEREAARRAGFRS
ncbi:osmoprotectant transport system permease protein [Methylobacterium sp. PvP062]|uniref:Binding-protein-dependent transport systems inner membrane component n=2 Tax=Methylobacterium radiotolerans TaxID=31998 RepID=B1LSX6_METRJ|nr:MULTISPECIES: ABC transporter permease [Methylobacterium]MCX7334927.1 ABC transporter permease [Hyphomicrobiales bacterium]GAN49415.1 ABC transporter permease [Methylobacterium sp. ME121]ACB26847.1 binding-protein-dependent transport systems inner membrane component [Methylobacterium radiotolerans JCM 2831]MBN6824627.1 ABC transporter permease [Methylobacterium organophilum]MBP2497912.1 osmoprotectant transport system permease protein [Methylobacterium sp. PvP105]